MTQRLLLTNDDGIEARGIAVLRAALDGLGEVTTIAPATNASGVARSITLSRPLAVAEREFGAGWRGHACDGYPADCVRVGFLGLRGPLPDLVVSGINHGSNLGVDVTYSGTVGAAFEAAVRGCPAIAFSIAGREPRWLDEAVTLVREITLHVMAHGMPRASILNVNFPDRPQAELAGMMLTRPERSSVNDRVFVTGAGDDGHVPQFAAAETQIAVVPDPTVAARLTDTEAVECGYVSLTPLRYELYDDSMSARFEGLLTRPQGG